MIHMTNNDLFKDCNISWAISDYGCNCNFAIPSALS